GTRAATDDERARAPANGDGARADPHGAAPRAPERLDPPRREAAVLAARLVGRELGETRERLERRDLVLERLLRVLLHGASPSTSPGLSRTHRLPRALVRAKQTHT